TFRRFRRLAVAIKGGLYRRALALDFAIGLLGLQVADAKSQATRRGINLHLAVSQLGVINLSQHVTGECIAQGFQRFRWQLFGAQFNQQIGALHYLAPFFLSALACFSSCWASCASTSSRIDGSASGKPAARRLAR